MSTKPDEHSLVRLAEAMGTALLDWARSSSASTQQSHRVVVDSDSILVFDPNKPQLDIEILRLVRILSNASDHAGSIVEYLQDPEAGRRLTSALRKALTMRDSLYQLSLLVTGLDLNEVENLSPSVIEFLTLREVDIYQQLKQVQRGTRDGVLSSAQIVIELEEVLEFIRGPYAQAKVEDNDDN